MKALFTKFVFSAAVIIFVVGGYGEQGATYGQSIKRGLGAGSGALTNSANARWAYNWGNRGVDSGYNGEYIPMFWRGGGNLAPTVERLLDERTSEYVLGFNEPERADQANITVATAINRWRSLTSLYAGTGIKLVSPAVSDNAAGREWLDDFMEIVDSDPTLHVDEVAFHWYGTVNINNPAGGASSFLNSVQRYHNLYNRNVWITEFAGLDFGNRYTTEQMNEWNRRFLDIVLPELESRDYVTKYAWWNHNNDSRVVEAGIFGRNRPTLVGDAYVGTLSSGDVRDMNGSDLGDDFQYLRGGQLLNNGRDQGAAFERLYALGAHDGSLQASQLGGSGDWSMLSGGSVTVEENAVVQKVGLNTVTFRDLDLEINGALVVLGGNANNGVLEISGSGTTARGLGLIQVNWAGSNLMGGTLALGREGDTGTLSLPYDFELRSSSIVEINSDVQIRGDTVVISPIYQVNHDFVYDGVMSSRGTTGFTKAGEATMTLNGSNTYNGGTTVREGSLLFNGTHFGGAAYNVNGGLLGGSGLIDSDVNLNSGSIAPGAEASAGTRLTIGGDLVQASGTTLALNVYGDSSDSLFVVGDLGLSGELVVQLMPDYVPQDGDEFTLVQSNQVAGDFSNVTVLGAPDNFETDVQIVNGDVVMTLTNDSSVMLGDVNRDGVVNFLDISVFVGFLSGSVYREEADIDQNGALNFLDITRFISLLSAQ